MDKLFKKVSEPAEESSSKVSVIGVGRVGMACAFTLLTKGISSHLALVARSEDKLKGELMDLQHCCGFLNSEKIEGSTDYNVTANSKVVIITSGVRQKGDQTRLDLLKENCEVFKKIIPQIIKYSPNAILLIATNPVDVLSYVAWKISGFPQNRIIGSGTNLDSSRFKFLISQKLDTPPTNVHAWIIGEHGNSAVLLQVPVWSGVNVLGIPLKQFNPKIGLEGGDAENWKDVHREVIESAAIVRKLKGYTSWAIALSVSSLVESIIRNDCIIHAVSTYVKGYHGIDEDVFLSLPCLLGANGATQIVFLTLSKDECDLLQKSAKILYKEIKQLTL